MIPRDSLARSPLVSKVRSVAAAASASKLGSSSARSRDSQSATADAHARGSGGIGRGAALGGAGVARSSSPSRRARAPRYDPAVYASTAPHAERFDEFEYADEHESLDESAAYYAGGEPVADAYGAAYGAPFADDADGELDEVRVQPAQQRTLVVGAVSFPAELERPRTQSESATTTATTAAAAWRAA